MNKISVDEKELQVLFKAIDILEAAGEVGPGMIDAARAIVEKLGKALLNELGIELQGGDNDGE